MLKKLSEILFLFSLMLFLSNSFVVAATTVRFSNSITPVVYVSNSSSFTKYFSPVVTIKNSSVTEADSSEIFIPFYDVNMSSADITTLQKSSILDDVTLIPSDNLNGFVRVYLSLNLNNTVNNYLYLAMKDTANSKYVIYSLLKQYTVTTPNRTNPIADYVDINLKDVCSFLTTQLDCTSFQTLSDVVKSNQFYIVALEKNVALPSDHTIIADSGLYLKLNMSNNIFLNNQLELTDLLKGDGRFFASWNGTNSSYIDSVYACVDPVNASMGGGGLLRDSCPLTSNMINTLNISYNGSSYIKPLINNTTYCTQMFYTNKWKFASLLSTTAINNCMAPELISVLLKKQTCFLLTAGFAGNHPTVQFFRFIRDAYLSHSVIGQSFIYLYYKLAPKFAMRIFKSEMLSELIRFNANLLSFLIHICFYFFLSSAIFYLFFYMYSFYSHKPEEK